MYDSSKEPCCMAHVTSGGRDEHEPGCSEELPRWMPPPPKCNHKRCRKQAVVMFRPYKDGWDVTKEVGKQYRCAQHGAHLLDDAGRAVRGVTKIRER